MDEDLFPIRRVAEVLGRHLRLPAGWDDAERQEFIAEAAEQVALRVAELADDWADKAVTEWGREHWRLPDSETQSELVRQARTAALAMVLSDVLPAAPDEGFAFLGQSFDLAAPTPR